MYQKLIEYSKNLTKIIFLNLVEPQPPIGVLIQFLRHWTWSKNRRCWLVKTSPNSDNPSDRIARGVVSHTSTCPFFHNLSSFPQFSNLNSNWTLPTWFRTIPFFGNTTLMWRYRYPIRILLTEPWKGVGSHTLGYHHEVWNKPYNNLGQANRHGKLTHYFHIIYLCTASCHEGHPLRKCR